LTKIEQFFSGAEPTLVTTHIHPDGDALGSLLAVTEFLEQRKIPAFPVMDSEVPSRFSFLPGSHRITTPSACQTQKQYHRVFALDVGNFERIGTVQSFIASDAKIINIDHHLSNPGFGTVNILRPECCATTEILWDIAQQLDLTITESIATNLYTGIFTDTGRFQFSNTTARAFEICAELVELGAHPEFIAQKLYFETSFEDIKRIGLLLAKMELFDHGRICSLRLNRINEVEDTDAILDMALSVQGVEVAVLIAPIRGGKSKVSLRSKQYFDVRKIAESFGGGGHPKAAGFRFRIDPDEMKNRLIPILVSALEQHNLPPYTSSNCLV
jgi:phosphoesterase RecJ-like protein